MIQATQLSITLNSSQNVPRRNVLRYFHSRVAISWKSPGYLLDFCSHLLDFFSSKISWISPGFSFFILYAEMFDRFLDSKNFFDNAMVWFFQVCCSNNIFQMIFKISRLVLFEDWVLMLNHIHIIFGAVATPSFLMYKFITL